MDWVKFEVSGETPQNKWLTEISSEKNALGESSSNKSEYSRPHF